MSATPATQQGEPSRAEHAGYVLGLADDALVMAQRMGEWVSRAPELEEDVALANIGLDLLGQARSLLDHAGSLMDPVRSEDDLAYLRDDRGFRNVHLVERPWQVSAVPGGGGHPDFAVAVTRLLLLSTYHCEAYAALLASSDPVLAAVAGKAVKEVDYHRDHATMWVLRLGDGTETSHLRAQAALDAEWPYLEELFDDTLATPALVAAGVAVAPSGLRRAVETRITTVLDQATLRRPATRPAVTGGRRGSHSEHLGYLLAEMQHLARSHPGASW